MWPTAAVLGGSYLMGAIPTSYLVGRAFRGIDLRQHGSKNLGATNLFRLMGWRFAVPVALFDMAKGAVPTVVLAPIVSGNQLFMMACGLMAVLGHMFSPFVGFKGGKGVATGSGVVLGLAPFAVLVTLTIWAAVVRLTGYVSLGSILAAAALPGAVYLLYPSRRETLWLMAGLAAMVIWMHRANIGRLLRGTENRFRQQRPPSETGKA